MADIEKEVAVNEQPSEQKERAPRSRNGRGNRGKKDFVKRPNKEVREELIKKTVAVNRVTKVVKGGRTMRFAALVVVGDGKGRVGLGMGKSGEVPEAIEKATQQARRSMVRISLDGNTIPHAIYGKFGRGNVRMIPAPEGTGIIAGGPVRSVLEAVGIKNIRTKALGVTNPINCAKATFEGLKELRTAEQVARARGKKVEDIL